MTCKDDIAVRLGAARERTFELLRLVPEQYLDRRVHSFYSPVGWHFGHIARTEEFWVSQALGRDVPEQNLSFLFADLPENPKENRTNLPPLARIVAYLRETRERTLQALTEADLESPSDLTAKGYAWEFALQHECQHQETILELLCLIQRDASTRPQGEPPVWRPGIQQEEVPVEGGTFCMGSDSPFAYDNEKEQHTATVGPMAVDRHPVTSYEWTEFMAQGGYEERALWSEEGWEWRTAQGVGAPEFWKALDTAWFKFVPEGLRPIHPDEPASCISKHEADAYARWSGKRLLTEEEREYLAASAVSRTAGPALDARTVGAQASVGDLFGCVWEWTSSPFLPYPGFAAFPYDGYSKAHMDGRHFVCRGGSWATANVLLRPSFRNWYVPSYRQGFLGARFAR
jgi:iron(II)-dependent oxidoreductase